MLTVESWKDGVAMEIWNAAGHVWCFNFLVMREKGGLAF